MFRPIYIHGQPRGPRGDRRRVTAGGVVEQHGTVRGRLLGPDGKVIEDGIAFPNAATTQGVNYLLDAGFKGGSGISSWYFGLINGAGFSGVSVSDLPNSHGGWTEMTDYSGDRKAWTTGTIAAGSLPTGTAASFTFTSAGSVRGIFIVSVNTKGDTTGTMWATAIDTSSRSVSNGQTLQIFYTNNLTPVA